MGDVNQELKVLLKEHTYITYRQAKTNMSPLFQSWRHKNNNPIPILRANWFLVFHTKNWVKKK